MSVFIRNIRCKVRVRTGRQSSALHQSESAQRPELAFVMPVNSNKEGTESSARMDSHDEVSPEEAPPRANAAKADTRAVADRVYDLMREEARLGRLRLGKN